jgi:hypothetical protein
MITPLEFLYHFRDLLRERGIRFAITSGMACVYYGLQQNTKDSDWIIEPADLPKLRALLLEHERRVPPWRISYRHIFGAPLVEEYLASGWTSHLAIWPSAGGPEEHVDWFGRPPRVQRWTVNEDGFADREVVAMMKRTDRDKDWPIIQGLGAQLASRQETAEALVHLQSAAELLAMYAAADTTARGIAAQRRPLLRLLEDEKERSRLTGWLRLERVVWECVNRQRHSRYQKAWKEFYRRWKKDDEWVWPTSEPWSQQHERVADAVRQHGLPVNPLEGVTMDDLVKNALADAAEVSFIPAEQLQLVCPPTAEMLPPLP